MDESDDQSQTEDSSAGMCNGSLGREIMSAVQRNEVEMQQQQTGKKVSAGKNCQHSGWSPLTRFHTFPDCALCGPGHVLR